MDKRKPGYEPKTPFTDPLVVDGMNPKVYGELDGDLARDNIAQDLPEADLADLNRSLNDFGGEDYTEATK